MKHSAGDIPSVDSPGAATITLFRPTGEEELALIAHAGFRAFPPRLPEQPIFYPVTTLAYAEQIARDWNARDGKKGFVTRFVLPAGFMQRYQPQIVGSAAHEEYWVPAEDLPLLNAAIIGLIDVVAEFKT
jgi:hypothetical protein